MIEKIKNLKFNIRNLNAGMTYVELIVVLSIFSVLASVSMFNYGAFQSKVDIKNLVNDIAVKVVEAQHAAAGGLLPPATVTTPSGWKPTYGVFFNMSKNTRFIYYYDLNSDGGYDHLGCTSAVECISQSDITKGNTLSSLDVFYEGDTTPHSLPEVSMEFIRPSSAPIFKSTVTLNPSISYVQITVISTKGQTAVTRVYASGRIEVH